MIKDIPLLIWRRYNELLIRVFHCEVCVNDHEIPNDVHVFYLVLSSRDEIWAVSITSPRRARSSHNSKESIPFDFLSSWMATNTNETARGSSYASHCFDQVLGSRSRDLRCTKTERIFLLFFDLLESWIKYEYTQNWLKMKIDMFFPS